MIFFLDFDRTIFDFDFFEKEILAPRPEFKTYLDKAAQFESGSLERQKIWAELASKLDYVDGSNFTQCVFPDSRSFFEKHASNIVIITFGNKSFQKLKVEKSLTGIEWKDTLYVEKGLKGPVVKKFLQENQEAVFVDDKLENLVSVKSECPWVSVYEMRRDGEGGEGSYPVIRDFNELESLI